MWPRDSLFLHISFQDIVSPDNKFVLECGGVGCRQKRFEQLRSDCLPVYRLRYGRMEHLLAQLSDSFYLDNEGDCLGRP